MNWGSLDQTLLTAMMDANARRPSPQDTRLVVLEAMVESALQSAALAEATGLGHDRMVLSAKVSGVQDLVDVYGMLAARCDFPLHLGLTEAGLGAKGIIASTAGLSILLQEGIGDTIRVSLTPEPEETAARRSASRSRSCSRWDSAASIRRLPPVPAAAGPPAPSFSRWRRTFRTICG